MTPPNAENKKKIRVLIVEDSPTVRELLSQSLSSPPDMEVVGVAKNGEEGLRLAESLKPDVITMDIEMPGLDGLETTRRIMNTFPTPIVIVSATTRPEEVELTFNALEAGAVAVLQKPYGPGNPQHQPMMDELVHQVRLMSGIRVVRRWKRATDVVPVTATPLPVDPLVSCDKNDSCPTVLAIGASTGGPPALRELFSLMPEPLNIPVLVVQHMSPGFIGGMIDWMRQASPLWNMKLAAHGEVVVARTVYFAADRAHMQLGADGVILLNESSKAEHGVKPSVSVLFRSLEHRARADSCALLLTGMGRDGALEMGALRKAGIATIAQEEAECVVFGMPGEALRLGHAIKAMPIKKMAAYLIGRYTDFRSDGAPDNE